MSSANKPAFEVVYDDSDLSNDAIAAFARLLLAEVDNNAAQNETADRCGVCNGNRKKDTDS